jgi:hypothetical protein
MRSLTIANDGMLSGCPGHQHAAAHHAVVEQESLHIERHRHEHNLHIEI